MQTFSDLFINLCFSTFLCFPVVFLFFFNLFFARNFFYIFFFAQQNNQVTLRYLFRLQKLLFLNTDYPELQQLWEIIVKKNNEIMVLKKL